MMGRVRVAAGAKWTAWGVGLLTLAIPLGASAQVPIVAPQTATPAAPQPPDGSPPVVRTIQIAFPAQGNVPSIEPSTYLYYIETRPSRASEDVWLPYDEQMVLDDFRALWTTGFLDDLSIEYHDEPYPNGVIGRNIVYNMEERERVRVVEFLGSEKLDRAKIEEAMTQMEAQIQLDTFVDAALLRKVKDLVGMMLAEAGYQSPDITHQVTPVAGGPKRVRVTFNIEDGPKTKIRRITFAGNEKISSRTLRKQMKANTEPKMWPISLFSSAGTYKEHRFPEDAEAIIQYYRNRGYIRAQVGQPQLTTLEDSVDGTERWVEMRLPITEGERYRLGNFELEGVTILREDALHAQFDLQEGDFYSEEVIRQGIERAQALYGASGYMEFLARPDLVPRDEAEGDNGDLERTDGPPIVDVTLVAEEGEQYFVKRISFSGNTTTRDHVIRREMRLYEGGVFNTEALKTSMRRINQLGYFIPLEEDAAEVEKAEGEDNQVVVMLPLDEQNRNSISSAPACRNSKDFSANCPFRRAIFSAGARR